VSNIPKRLVLQPDRQRFSITCCVHDHAQRIASDALAKQEQMYVNFRT